MRGLVESKDELALGVDTRLARALQAAHPASAAHDAEKVITRGDRVERVYRTIPYDEATGEFIRRSEVRRRGRGPVP